MKTKLQGSKSFSAGICSTKASWIIVQPKPKASWFKIQMLLLRQMPTGAIKTEQQLFVLLYQVLFIRELSTFSLFQTLLNTRENLCAQFSA